MCHIILLLPLLALPILWLFPLAISVPVYSVVLALSAVVYMLAMRAMRLPIAIGPETLVHQVGEVLSREIGYYRIPLQDEVWNARSDEPIKPGDRIEVLSVDGATLMVKHANPSPGSVNGAG